MQTRKVFIVTVYYVQLFAENIHLLYRIRNLPDTHASLVFSRMRRSPCILLLGIYAIIPSILLSYEFVWSCASIFVIEGELTICDFAFS